VTITYVRGPKDLSNGEYDRFYAPRIEAAWKRGDSFVVGDCQGTDYMAQRQLAELNAGARQSLKENSAGALVIVFHCGKSPKWSVNRRGKCRHETRGGHWFEFTKKFAMWSAADIIIDWHRCTGEGHCDLHL